MVANTIQEAPRKMGIRRKASQIAITAPKKAIQGFLIQTDILVTDVFK